MNTPSLQMMGQLTPPLAMGARAQEPGGPTFQAKEPSELRDAFNDFVGQTFFGQLLAEMRKSVKEPAYFHGGHAEKVFQGQLDQALVEQLSDSTADRFAGPMYDLFMLPR